jgi:sirohydrochlorin cobaltochelatase
VTATSLVLVGHGFPRRPHARHPAHDHAERLQEAEPLDEVTPALMKGEPSLETALRSIPGGRAVVVPLFVSDGYFVGEALPERVEDNRPEGLTVEYAQPIGTHEKVTDVLTGLALSAIDGPPEGVELALLGHGSEHGSANREAVGSHACRIAERGTFAAVRSYFIEEEPGVELLPTEAGAEETVAVPVFVAEGGHVREDIPEQLGIEGRDGTVEGTHVTCTDPVGTDPMVAGIAFGRAMGALRTAGWEQELDSAAKPAKQIRRNTP